MEFINEWGDKNSSNMFSNSMNISERNVFLLEKFHAYYQTLDATAQDNLDKRKTHGIYYTPYNLAHLLIRDIKLDEALINKTFLDPCAGFGTFIFAYLDFLIQNGIIDSEKTLIKFLKNIFYGDIDEIAVLEFEKVFKEYFMLFYGWNVEFPKKNIFIGDSLFAKYPDSIIGEELCNYFDTKCFDLIYTNPPYLLLKKSQTTSMQTDQLIDSINYSIKNSDHFKFLSGVNNLYKLFVEQIVEHWSDSQSQIGLLIPKGLLSDSSSAFLRKRILETSMLGNIYDIPEASSYFPNVGQSFTMFSLIKGLKTNQIIIYGYEDQSLQITTPVTDSNLYTYNKITSNCAIFPLKKENYHLLSKLSELPKLASFPTIENLRGELDLTLDKSYISDEITELKLIKGSDISHYNLKSFSGYVKRTFNGKAKGHWNKKSRIACQQISNQNQVRRLKWCLIPPGHVLGNSCNYIGITEPDGLFEQEKINLYYLLAVLNSDFMNERFKILSANNHVSNLEISDMPCVFPDISRQNEIGDKAIALTREFDEDLFNECENELKEIFFK